MFSTEQTFYAVYKLSGSELLDAYWNIQGDGEVSPESISQVLKWLQHENVNPDENSTSWTDAAVEYFFQNPEDEVSHEYDSWVIHRYHNTRTWTSAVETYRHNFMWETWDLEAEPTETNDTLR